MEFFQPTMLFRPLSSHYWLTLRHRRNKLHIIHKTKSTNNQKFVKSTCVADGTEWSCFLSFFFRTAKLCFSRWCGSEVRAWRWCRCTAPPGPAPPPAASSGPGSCRTLQLPASCCCSCTDPAGWPTERLFWPSPSVAARERERESGWEGSGIFTCLHSKMYFELIVACLSANIDGSRKVLWTRNFNRLSQSDVNIYILEGHGASAGFFCSTSSPPGPGLLPEPPPPDTEKHSYKH